MKCLILLCLVAFSSAASVNGQAALDEEFGYVTVRTGAHMFWALYHTDQPGDYTTYPLIMWLQGGPGSSGVGYGNFMELGPYDINGNLRPYAWTKKANILFVDNPVGTGYSYAENSEAFTTDNDQISKDLVYLVKDVFQKNTDLQNMPFFVYAESYGGKMTVDFAIAFNDAIKNGEVVSDFRGIALGDSWISPMDSVNTWGSFLYNMGFVNRKGMEAVDAAAAITQQQVDQENWVEATIEWANTEDVVSKEAHGVDFYNILAVDTDTKSEKPHSRDLSYMSPQVRNLYKRHVLRRYGLDNDALNDFMNGDQAKRWSIPDEVVWDSQGGTVFQSLAGDFMKPVIDSVTKLLTETDLQVAVYSGNLDLICDTPGTYKWIENMEWPGKQEWLAAPNEVLHVSSYSSQAALVQHAGQFSMFTIFRAGHMVPIDAPEASLVMIDKLTSFSNEAKEKQKEKEQIALPAIKQKPAKSEESPKSSNTAEIQPQAPSSEDVEESPESSNTAEIQPQAPSSEDVEESPKSSNTAEIQPQAPSSEDVKHKVEEIIHKVHRVKKVNPKGHAHNPRNEAVHTRSHVPTALDKLTRVQV